MEGTQGARPAAVNSQAVAIWEDGCSAGALAQLLRRCRRMAMVPCPKAFRAYAGICSKSPAFTWIAACWLISSSVSTNRRLLPFLTRVP